MQWKEENINFIADDWWRGSTFHRKINESNQSQNHCHPTLISDSGALETNINIFLGLKNVLINELTCFGT